MKLSPDDKRAAFLDVAGKRRLGIESVPVAGGVVTTLIAATRVPVMGDCFAWNNDGKQLALEFRDQKGGLGRIGVINADGSGFRPVTPEISKMNLAYHHPAYSPDGRQIAFSVLTYPKKGRKVLKVEVGEISTDGSGGRVLVQLPVTYMNGLTWGTNGQILISDNLGLGIVDAKSGSYSQLDNSTNFYGYYSPVFSPDGQDIAVSMGPGYRYPDIRAGVALMNADGTGLDTVATIPENNYPLDLSWR